MELNEKTMSGIRSAGRDIAGKDIRGVIANSPNEQRLTAGLGVLKSGAIHTLAALIYNAWKLGRDQEELLTSTLDEIRAEVKFIDDAAAEAIKNKTTIIKPGE